MKISSHLLGRVVLYANIDELLPERSTHVPEAIPLLSTHYGFNSSPQLSQSVESLRENGLKFQMGRFTASTGEEVLIQDFTVWNDGLVVTAYTTEDAEKFFEDFFDWGRQALGIHPNFAALKIRHYLSQLVAEFEHSLAERLAVFQALSERFNKSLLETYKTQFPPSEVVSIRLDYDRAVAASALKALGSLLIERRENHRFSEDNVYFCQAPLRTADHISLLEQFEAILG